MNDASLNVVPFPPGAFITLDDPTTGARRLALVCDSGTEFVDVVDYDQPATPLAILDVLAPEQWGDCRGLASGLLLDGHFEDYEAFSALLVALCDTPAGGDPLTLNRAAKWAFENGNYDVGRAAQAGLVATAEARARQGELARVAKEWIEAGVV